MPHHTCSVKPLHDNSYMVTRSRARARCVSPLFEGRKRGPCRRLLLVGVHERYARRGKPPRGRLTTFHRPLADRETAPARDRCALLRNAQSTRSLERSHPAQRDIEPRHHLRINKMKLSVLRTIRVLDEILHKLIAKTGIRFPDIHHRRIHVIERPSVDTASRAEQTIKLPNLRSVETFVVDQTLRPLLDCFVAIPDRDLIALARFPWALHGTTRGLERASPHVL